MLLHLILHFTLQIAFNEAVLNGIGSKVSL